MDRLVFYGNETRPTASTAKDGFLYEAASLPENHCSLFIGDGGTFGSG